MNDRLAALDFLGACLTVEVNAENTAVLQRGIAQQTSWHNVIALANAHFLTPALWVALEHRRCTSCLPKEIQEYLSELYRLNAARNEKLRVQVIEAARALNAIAISPVLLKGTASLFDQTYDDPGTRMMTDIDLLVPEERARECCKTLQELGYDSHPSDEPKFKTHHHLPPLFRVGDYAAIEIHKSIVGPARTGRVLGARLTEGDAERITDQVRECALPLKREAVSMSVPINTHRVLHLILHSAFMDGHHRRGTLPLRSIHELALIANRFTNDIDWRRVGRTFGANRELQVVSDWVYLAHRLFGSPIPQGFEARLRCIAHYTRCRLQARWGVALTLRTFERIPLVSGRNWRMHG